jgi:hypothetical protein
MNKLGKGILIVCCVAGVSALFAMRIYYKQNAQVIVVDPATLQKNNAWNKHTVDTAVSLLRSGYLVLRMGSGADSRMLAELNRKDKTYSHCGIVMIEHDYPFVYHSIGGEDNPDERLRRDSASFFFSPKHNMGIAVVRYDYSDAQVNELKKVVYQYYKERPKFDMKFDLNTDDKLYCAEFVYKAVNKAVSDPLYIKTTSFLGYTFVGIDDLFINSHACMVWQTGFK